MAMPSGEVSLGTIAGETLLDYYAYLPRAGADHLLVTVHGISESARSHVDHFAALAERYRVLVVAPHFQRPAWQDYQRLGRVGKGPRADLALERLVASLGCDARVRTGRFFLFGYSGGAQFVHRYVMAHPRRVVAAVVSSAGWYTFPDSRRGYPFGIRGGRALPGVEFEADAFLRVPLLVTVGDNDLGRDETLRRSDRLDREQGLTRPERAERFVAAMRRAAESRGIPSQVRLRVLREVGHSFEDNAADAGLIPLVFDHFFAPRARSASTPRS